MKTIKFKAYDKHTNRQVTDPLSYYMSIDDNGTLNVMNNIIVCQLRYTSPNGTEYYDGDIYYHAGYGEETVSDICELQAALLHGNTEDICHIIGNIHTKTV